MRLNNISVIFALIFSVVFSMINFEIRELNRNEYLEIYNKKLIEHASNDATFVLKKSAEIYGNSIIIDSKVDAKLVFDSFFKSLTIQMGKNSKSDIEKLKKYFPLLCLVENDGIVLSSYIEIKNDDGVFIKRMIFPKFKFFIENKGIIYYPCLNGEVTVLYEEDNVLKEESGYPEDLLARGGRAISLSYLEQDNIQEIINEEIRLQISNLLTEEIERHEKEMAKMGMHYDFFLPEKYTEDSFYIDSPCLITLMQGYPLSPRTKSNTMNICKMDIKKSDFYSGFIENGIRYYLPNSDPSLNAKTVIEAFSNEISAVKAGYFKYE